jgi:flagellar motility protein MotE (MotC chaperone)
VRRRTLIVALLAAALTAPALAQDPPPTPTPTPPEAVPLTVPPVEGAASEARGVDDTTIDALEGDSAIDLAERMRIFKQARKREKEVEALEASLARKQQRLEAVKRDVEGRYKTLRMLQEELSAVVDEESRVPPDEAAARKEAEEKAFEDKVRQLSKVFDKMKPAEAAKVIEQMDEKLVVQVLRRLKARQAAKVLGNVEPKLAARLSEKMAQVDRAQKRRRRN